jgi:transcription elongation factor Elf1
LNENIGRNKMAKIKKSKIVHEHPIKLGDKFICPHCKAVVPVKHDCPECRLEMDWSKV